MLYNATSNNATADHYLEWGEGSDTHAQSKGRSRSGGALRTNFSMVAASPNEFVFEERRIHSSLERPKSVPRQSRMRIGTHTRESSHTCRKGKQKPPGEIYKHGNPIFTTCTFVRRLPSSSLRLIVPTSYLIPNIPIYPGTRFSNSRHEDMHCR